MNSLTESLSEKYTAEELRGNIKDVIRRKGRRRIPEFSLKRRGVAGYDKNLDKVFRTFAGSVSKYVYMDELKYDYVNLMERKGWGEVSEVSDEARPVANWLRSWWDDVNNRPQETEIQIDKALNTLEKSVPKNILCGRYRSYCNTICCRRPNCSTYYWWCNIYNDGKING